MSEKTRHQENEKKSMFTFAEVDNITQVIQNIYALDDAIANQMALKRPVSFVQPLNNIRAGLNETLKSMMLKGQPQQVQQEKEPDVGEDPATQ